MLFEDALRFDIAFAAGLYRTYLIFAPHEEYNSIHRKKLMFN